MKRGLNWELLGIGCGLVAGMMAPGHSWGCACGCGVFDVGTSSMLPTGQGGMVFLNVDYQDQDRNWSGTSEAPAANNDDKDLETVFTSVGVQYMFNRSWGAQIELPWDFRHFRGTEANGTVTSANWNQLGDIRIEGIYTGFFADLSGGLTFGVKLPTGSYSFDPALVDRDTQIGTGSTDLLLGGFYRHNLGKNQWWDWFNQAKLDVPVLTQGDYHPGLELDAATGIDYRGLSLGHVHIAPVAQVIFSGRTSDHGEDANSDGTGYTRILLSPGVEFHVHPVRIYADAEFPVFQDFTGNQLAASVLFKVTISWMF